MAQTIPRKDTEFDEVQNVITTKTALNLEKWKIDSTWFNEQIIPAKAAWTAVWAAWQDPNDRSKVIVFNKNQARNAYEILLSKLIQMLKASPFITPSELVELGINTSKGGGGHNPPPNTYPGFHILPAGIRLLLLYFYALNSKSHAKPHGVHGAEIRWAILDAMPTDISELINSSFDTRSPFRFEFADKDRGKTIWFCLRWESTTGEKGPWSGYASAVIP